MGFDLGEFTLPDDHYSEACSAQRPDRCRVAGAVASELGNPKFAVRLRHSSPATPRMLVPETAVYKHGPTTRPIGEVWGARKGANVLSIEKSELTQGATDGELRRGPRLTDATEKTASAGVRRDRFHAGQSLFLNRVHAVDVRTHPVFKPVDEPEGATFRSRQKPSAGAVR